MKRIGLMYHYPPGARVPEVHVVDPDGQVLGRLGNIVALEHRAAVEEPQSITLKAWAVDERCKLKPSG